MVCFYFRLDVHSFFVEFFLHLALNFYYSNFLLFNHGLKFIIGFFNCLAFEYNIVFLYLWLAYVYVVFISNVLMCILASVHVDLHYLSLLMDFCRICAPLHGQMCTSRLCDAWVHYKVDMFALLYICVRICLRWCIMFIYTFQCKPVCSAILKCGQCNV